MTLQALTVGSLGGLYLNETATLQALAAGAYVNTSSGGTSYNDSVTEAMVLADAVSSVGTFVGAITETMTLADVTGVGGGIFNGTIAEAIMLVDVVASNASFTREVSESMTLNEALSATGTFAALVTESIPLISTERGVKARLRWFLSFAQVTPPPEGQGPGNAGKLFGDFRYEEEED